MSKSSLLLSAATVALLTGTPALADGAVATSPTEQTVTASATLSPLYGNVQAYYRDINAFEGDLSALYRDINAFDGALDPFARDINAFEGDLNAFYRDINAFDGSTSPFWGEIELFWGDLDPYARDINAFARDINAFWGDLSPYARDINAFGRDIGAFWGEIGNYWERAGAFWGELNLEWRELGAYAEDPEAYDDVWEELRELVRHSSSVWGQAVQDQTGQNFWNGFAAGVFAKHGFDHTDPASIENISEGQRARFFLDWYDGLMGFSGVDRVDYWMPQVNWTPSLTQDQGSGGDAVIGLLDFSIVGDTDLIDNLEYDGGVSGVSNGHGAAVAGLMVAAHDGEGVMGIAPNARVVAYNPFDESGTADFPDVTSGIVRLGQAGASVINMSLGVPGGVLNEGWRDVFFDPQVLATNAGTVFVKAAGNDGSVQTQDVEWRFDAPTNLIIVGSVNPANEISLFSNTPGEACLLNAGVCAEENKLKYKFLVAPGEMILVSDDAGGVTRATGTSFAAPIVSGAVALMHDRWPWMEAHPEETVDIIFQTARDLGAPGVDAVYGWGLLDIEASQSPINFDDLEYFQYATNGSGKLKSRPVSASQAAQQKSFWETQKVYFIAFEEIGDTYRDFAIPFSSQLIGQTVDVNGREERFQRHIYERMVDWSNAGFTDMTTAYAPMRDDVWSIGLTASNHAPNDYVQDDELPYRMGFVAHNVGAGVTLRTGVGSGALDLTQREGFGLFSDYDGERGGVNPYLGLASGGAYAGADFALSSRVSLSVGLTERTNEKTYTDFYSGEERDLVDGLDDYRAAAANIALVSQVSERVTARLDYTMLREGTGLLGVQGLDPIDLSGGAVTDALTVGSDVAFGGGWSIAGSATFASTRDGALGEGVLVIDDGGLESSALQVAAAKLGVFAKADKLRVSLAQPLSVNDGSLSFTQLAVIDRTTGERGPVTQTIDLASGANPLVIEALYAAPLLNGAAQISAFARTELQDSGSASEETGGVIGGRLSTRF